MGESLTNALKRSQPVIAMANWFQFGAGERFVSPCVESRLLLWCVHGRGRVRVDGAWCELAPDDWVVMPWKHETLYEADPRHPFLVGAVHVIPNHDPAVPVVFRIAHTKADPLAGNPHRRDAAWPGFETVVGGHFADNDGLHLLATYIVRSFQDQAVDEARLRALARLLVGDLLGHAASHGGNAPATPAVLRQMQEYVRSHLDRRIPVIELAGLANVSPATAHRLFRRHAGCGPREWIATTRLVEAERLLRTTNSPVGAIGERVGFADPFHFSRFFRRHAGVSPREFRQRRKLL